MTYGEAWRLMGLLTNDPATQVAAALARWENPVSREALVLMDLYDLQHASKSRRKPKPYPRPSDNAARKRYGATTLPPDQAIALLSQFGHRPAGKPPQKRDARGRFAA